ncbi:hypothetical protein AB0F17_59650 [Nonomuraea sp. NPDC026600]|uniref:hypothetical protein n=1 Tax=Nonomuraea sp. NPDC026600 TaxID=3155363 RepID=UPI0033D4DB7D
MTRRRQNPHVFEVLPYRHSQGGREYLVHQDGSVIRGRYAGGNIAEESAQALAEASGYRVWFRRLHFLGIADRAADPLLYPYTIDLTATPVHDVPGPAMVWADEVAMSAIGDPRNHPRTIALYDRVIAHLQESLTRGADTIVPAPFPLTPTVEHARNRSHQE